MVPAATPAFLRNALMVTQVLVLTAGAGVAVAVDLLR